MVLPRSLARLNRVGFNRLSVHVAPWLPGFGVVEHTGRRSGTSYRTPVNVFGDGHPYVLALTYGADSDWVRNVRAAGGCALVTRGHRHHVVAPQLRHDPAHSDVPRPLRPVLSALGVDDVLLLTSERSGS